MKNRIHKILGIGLALVLALALVAGFALPVAAAETINEWYTFDYPVEGEPGDWFYDPDIDEVRELTQAINGDLYVYVQLDNKGETHHIFKSTDGGRSWAETKYCDATDGVVGGTVYDMVCSSIDEDVVYATDGFYVYKTDDGGDTWSYVARDSLEEQLGGDCGCDLSTCIDYVGSGPDYVITSIDVAYDDDDNPFVYIGTREHNVTLSGDPNNVCYPCATPTPVLGDVYWIGEAGYPAMWTSLNLDCFHGGGYDAIAVGCAPDWADTKHTYVVITANPEVDDGYDHTWVVYTTGTICGWVEFAELLWNCYAPEPATSPNGNFESRSASRIAFPDDWEDTETLFVGVTTFFVDGGDVYMAMDGSAIDMNVEGIKAACVGKEDDSDIISLDIEGDTDEASLIAGAFWDAHVYYSYDGGWEWEESEKDPTGTRWTYVIWYGDSALAATSGNECAVSLSCITDEVEDAGECWNQISLIATDIECVADAGFSPGYITDSETMFALAVDCNGNCYAGTYSVFRYDGTYWERVWSSTIYVPDLGWVNIVQVSPDFNETNTVFVANNNLEVWRSQDAGCSWHKMTFPCAPRPTVWACAAIDEDTFIAGGAADELVYKTTRHGARPWDEYDVTGAGNVTSFDLEPGYEDPGSVLLGDDKSQVFISEDGGEEWDLVGDCATILTGSNETSVVFDPAYATTGIIYAAAGDRIARCVIDPDEDWADQAWEEIYHDPDLDLISPAPDDDYWGIVAAGDTALYVGDRMTVGIDDGGMLRSLNPDTDDADDVVFERLTAELPSDATLMGLKLTTDVSDDGCAENVLWAIDTYPGNLGCTFPWGGPDVYVYEDTLAAPVVLDTPLEGHKLTTTHSATLSWNELCGADCYEVSLFRYCPECPEEKVEVDISDLMDCHDVCEGTPVCYECTEDICIVVDGLESGSTYYWQVRVCIGEPTLSKWSEERTFTTALLDVAILCSPVCGGQDIILTPNFSWDKVSGATGYDIELATTETFTAGVVRGSSTVNAWVTQPLEYATTYYWRVRAEKDGVYSDWAVCIFTTIEKAVPPPPPVVVEPTPPAPVVPTPIIEFPPTPNWVWAIIGIGTALVVVVIVLTVRTRRPPA